jgi:hypothetical protein
LRRFLAGLVVLGVAGGLVVGFFLYQSAKLTADLRNGRLERELEEAMGTADLPATEADEVLGALWEAAEDVPSGRDPWSLAAGEEVSAPLDAEVAGDSLAESRTLRERFLGRMTDDLEPPEEDVLLNRIPNFRDQRTCTRFLAEDLLSLLVVGDEAKALAAYRAGQRHARLIGRGVGGRPTLIAKMIATAQQRVLDDAVGTAARLGLVPASATGRWQAAVLEAVEAFPPIDRSMEGEFAATEAMVEIADRRFGPLGLFLEAHWGDGHAQLARVRATYEAGEEVPREFLQGELHPMVMVGIPNWPAAERRCDQRRERGREVAAALAR